jgi:hypothetical protein
LGTPTGLDNRVGEKGGSPVGFAEAEDFHKAANLNKLGRRHAVSGTAKIRDPSAGSAGGADYSGCTAIGPGGFDGKLGKSGSIVIRGVQSFTPPAVACRDCFWVGPVWQAPAG